MQDDFISGGSKGQSPKLPNMPVLNDRQGISQGWGACRPPGKSDFIKCFIVLDRQKQQLICYNGSSGKTSAQVSK